MRRVVTGVGPDGTGRVVRDGPPPCVIHPEELAEMAITYVWATDTTVQVPNPGEEPTRPDQDFFPGPGESRFVVISYPPGFGAGPPGRGAGTLDTAPGHLDRLLMHATATVDFAIVLQGEITLVLESGEEVTLRPTDTVVQNGAVHGWRNVTDGVAVIGFVMIGPMTST